MCLQLSEIIEEMAYITELTWYYVYVPVGIPNFLNIDKCVGFGQARLA